MRWTLAATVGCLLFVGAGCAKSDCTRAREALGRVVADMQGAPEPSHGLSSAAFAERMQSEIEALEIEEAELKRTLDAFVAASRDLAHSRNERDRVALERARAHDHLLGLRADLDAAYAELARVCEHGRERCIVQSEIARIEASINRQRQDGPEEPVSRVAAKIRSTIDETRQTMQTMVAADKDLAELEQRIDELERHAAGLGLQIGAQCPG